MIVLDVVLALLALIALIGTIRSLVLLRRYRYRLVVSVAANDKPSVSICIAARNECHALSQCLEHVLASKYEKLEILVLDDSSEDDTSYIIKSFAQGGVRFIAGQSLPDGWLGKNHAYYTLAQEANGDILLFLDVDTLLAPDSISRLTDTFISSQLSSLSVLPRREDGYRSSALMGTLRYFWELILSTRLRPPAASALFMMKREKFKLLLSEHPHLGSDIRLETRLATLLRDGYRYIIATNVLGILYEKRWLSQVETATRLYYPIIGANAGTLLLAIVLLAGIAFLGVASILLIGGVYPYVPTVYYLAIGSTFGIFTWFTMAGGWWNVLLRAIFWPLLAVQELALILNSFVRYKLTLVTWKGRRLTDQPVNHTYHKIDE